MIDAMADWSKGLIFRVVVVGYVLNQIQSAASFQTIFSVVGLLALLSFACHLVNILLKNCFFPRSDLKIQSHFMKLAFGKARQVDLECYENTEYFEKHIRALNALKSRPRMVLDSVEMLFGALFGFLALSRISSIKTAGDMWEGTFLLYSAIKRLHSSSFCPETAFTQM